jgi:hypothetical protein
MLEIRMIPNTSTHNDNRCNYRLNIQTPLDNPDRVLFDYLMLPRAVAMYSHKEMALAALRAYWMPIAYEHYRHQLGVPLADVQLRQMARNAIAHLRERAEMLNHHFCAELDQIPIPRFTRADRRYFLSQQAEIASPLLIQDTWGPDEDVLLRPQSIQADITWTKSASPINNLLTR